MDYIQDDAHVDLKMRSVLVFINTGKHLIAKQLKKIQNLMEKFAQNFFHTHREKLQMYSMYYKCIINVHILAHLEKRTEI